MVVFTKVVAASHHFFQLRSSLKVETAPSEVDPSSIDVERCVVDHVGCFIFYSFRCHFVLSYRGEPLPIEVEVKLVLRIEWCFLFVMDL